MRARPVSGHAAEWSGGAADEAMRKTDCLVPRTPRVKVTDPRITVVEGPEPVDPAALDTAITLFVKWAIRAHESASYANTVAPEAPTADLSADYTPSN